MSRRQNKRGSRFQVDIEARVRVAAVAFRDSDIETSVAAAVHLWWGSGLRGRRFAQLARLAREVTQERVSLGLVERGQPGRREAMPYFLAVLRDLAIRDRRDVRVGEAFDAELVIPFAIEEHIEAGVVDDANNTLDV